MRPRAAVARDGTWPLVTIPPMMLMSMVVRVGFESRARPVSFDSRGSKSERPKPSWPYVLSPKVKRAPAAVTTIEKGLSPEPPPHDTHTARSV